MSRANSAHPALYSATRCAALPGHGQEPLQSRGPTTRPHYSNMALLEESLSAEAGKLLHVDVSRVRQRLRERSLRQGEVRYASSNRPFQQIGGVGVKLSPLDLLGQKTALFGKHVELTMFYLHSSPATDRTTSNARSSANRPKSCGRNTGFNCESIC